VDRESRGDNLSDAQKLGQVSLAENTQPVKSFGLVRPSCEDRSAESCEKRTSLARGSAAADGALAWFILADEKNHVEIDAIGDEEPQLCRRGRLLLRVTARLVREV